MASDFVLIPFGTAFLRITQAEFNAVMARGLDPGPNATPALPAAVPERLLDSRELADRLGCTADLCEAKAKTGEWPSMRVGRYLRFDRAAVMAALAQDEESP